MVLNILVTYSVGILDYMYDILEKNIFMSFNLLFMFWRFVILCMCMATGCLL
jgi:hypothetical protein